MQPEQSARQTTRRAFLTFTVVGVAGATLTGCSFFGIDPTTRSDPDASVVPRPEPQPRTDTPEASSRILVAYFSVPETDDPNGMTQDEENSTHVVDGVVYGNTQYAAMLMAERLGAELFRIETVEELPLDHDTLIEFSREWMAENARPELREFPNLAEYDTVIVGYPIWDFDMPMPLYTFFEQQDFTGKNVTVFTTHDVSGLSGTLETVTAMLPGANVSQNAFDISRSDMDDSEARVNAWLDTTDLG